MSEIANPGLELAEGIFKSLAWDLVVTGALAALFTAAPALGVWPLRGFITGVVHLFTETMYSLLKRVFDVTAISMINLEHQKAYDKESLKLKIIAHDRGIDSEEFKKARENAKADLSKFVRFGAA